MTTTARHRPPDAPTAGERPATAHVLATSLPERLAATSPRTTASPPAAGSPRTTLEKPNPPAVGNRLATSSPKALATAHLPAANLPVTSPARPARLNSTLTRVSNCKTQGRH